MRKVAAYLFGYKSTGLDEKANVTDEAASGENVGAKSKL